MKKNNKWPKHFYLIGSDNPPEHHKVGPNSMGSKAFNLLRMSELGLTVPPALVLGTHYTKASGDWLDAFYAVGLPALEATAGMRLDDPKNPLILSVRSGAPVSMPGMMETLLNIGLTENTLGGFLRQTGNPRLVWDSYRRLIATYGEVVAGIPGHVFEDALEAITQGRDERTLDFDELRTLANDYLDLYEIHAHTAFPQSSHAQVTGAIEAVFASWHSDKAKEYRNINAISDALGTAVTLQRMVFGNSGTHAGSGVGFTRNPTSGEKSLWIDFLLNAQGEDVVSGRRNAHGADAMASLIPDAWQQLQKSTRALELEFMDMQDFEFTVEDGQLYMLQTRSGKRTHLATAQIALDLLDEDVIDKRTAKERTAHLTQDDLVHQVLAPNDDSTQDARPIASAMSACSGIVAGEIALDEARARERHAAGANVILIRQDAETNDIGALSYSVGLLTERGARTSHAAVVARQLGKVCLVGCPHLKLDPQKRTASFGEITLTEGDMLTLDGNEGLVYSGHLSVINQPDTQLFARLESIRHGGKHD